MGYKLLERYTVPCLLCGSGCIHCRQGIVPVYVITKGAPSWRCLAFKHRWIGEIDYAVTGHQLPRVAWCLRTGCDVQKIQTDVPEAYDLTPLPPPQWEGT